MMTLGNKFKECAAKAWDYGFKDMYIALVQSQDRYLIIRVDDVFEGGFKSEDIYYGFNFPFAPITQKMADILYEKISKNEDIAAVELNLVKEGRFDKKKGN